MEIPAAKLLGIPIVTHCRLITNGASPFLRYSNKIIGNSRFTLKTINYSQAELVYNCVDLRAFDDKKGIRREIGLSQNDIVVSFIGRLIEEKGIEMFAELARRLNGKATFLIAGDAVTGEYFKKIMDMMTNNVIYVGYRNDIEDIYISSDIIVVPSQREESFGRICIEAGAAKKPVVATRVGGIPEIVEHGNNGFLVNKDDLDAMLKFTQELIDNAQLREEMGRKGRKLAEEKFSIGKHVGEIERIYEELL
jgi:glycosyltransferase involved in cell wall biosynthesis